MNSVMPLTSACSMRFPTAHERHYSDGTVSFEAGCRLQQAFRGIGTAVEHHVLAQLAKLRIDLVINGKLARINDAHVHSELDGVEQEHRVHGLAHGLVATEREGEVRHAARDMGMRQALADDACRLQEVDAVAVVLLD